MLSRKSIDNHNGCFLDFFWARIAPGAVPRFVFLTKVYSFCLSDDIAAVGG
jgi:hypothetical protein